MLRLMMTVMMTGDDDEVSEPRGARGGGCGGSHGGHPLATLLPGEEGRRAASHDVIGHLPRQQVTA